MSDQLSLLDVPETLSPRLVWMLEKDVKTVLLLADGVECELTGRDGPLWACWYGEAPETHAQESAAVMKSRLCYATTEEDAITRLAQRNGWKLWNEV